MVHWLREKEKEIGVTPLLPPTCVSQQLYKWASQNICSEVVCSKVPDSHVNPIPVNSEPFTTTSVLCSSKHRTLHSALPYKDFMTYLNVQVRSELRHEFP